MSVSEHFLLGLDHSKWEQKNSLALKNAEHQSTLSRWFLTVPCRETSNNRLIVPHLIKCHLRREFRKKSINFGNSKGDSLSLAS